MSTRTALQPRVLSFAVVLCAVVTGMGILAALEPRDASAQRSSPTPAPIRTFAAPSPTAAGPRFCGVTLRGGTVQMQFSEDGHRILWFELRERGVQFHTHESCVPEGAPVSERRFIMSCEDVDGEACPRPTQRRCEQAPCSPTSTPRPTAGPRPSATREGPGGPGRCRVAPCYGPQAAPPPMPSCGRRVLESVQIVGGLDTMDLRKAIVAGHYQVRFRDGPAFRFVVDGYTAWNREAAPCP